MASLQAALPGPYYTDEGHWAREAQRVLLREWFCAGRLATWGLEDGSTERGSPRRLSDLDATLLGQIEAFFVDYNRLRQRTFEPLGRRGPRTARAIVADNQVRLGRPVRHA